MCGLGFQGLRACNTRRVAAEVTVALEGIPTMSVLAFLSTNRYIRMETSIKTYKQSRQRQRERERGTIVLADIPRCRR